MPYQSKMTEEEIKQLLVQITKKNNNEKLFYRNKIEI